MTTPATIHVDAIPRPFASAYTALTIVEAGAVPVRVVTEPGHADNGRTIAPGETVELEPRGFTFYLVANSPTTVAVTKFTVDDLRADAAEFYRVPVDLITGRDKAAIAESAARFLRHELPFTEETAQ